MRKGAIEMEMVVKIAIGLVILILVYLIVIKNIFNIGSTALGSLG